MNFEVFANKANKFLYEINESIVSNELQLEAHWNIDHICYRVESDQRYLELKNEFSKFSRLLTESIVNNRKISTFKLLTPLNTNQFSVNIIELPAPKKNNKYKEGFEHLEVVCDISFNHLINKYHMYSINKSGLEKSFNQELAVKFKNFAVKFHHTSLESVVNIEINELVFSSIQKLGVLNTLSPFNPLIVGTLPLDIHTPSSDVDIIFSHTDLSQLKEILVKNYSHLDKFSIDFKPDKTPNYILANFQFNNTLFELYGSTTPTLEQRAFKHFNLQERLLKIGCTKFKQQIKTLRKKGFKTEPAFASAMNIKGDPYENLLDLYNSSELSLLSAITKD